MISSHYTSFLLLSNPVVLVPGGIHWALAKAIASKVVLVTKTICNITGGFKMSDLMKVMLVGLIVLYVVSPIDACPGPIDDLIVVLLGVAANKCFPERE